MIDKLEAGITLAHVDRPDAPEIFADNVRSTFVADGVLRIELVTTRMDAPKPGATPVCRTSTSGWVVLTMNGMQQLKAQLDQQAQQLMQLTATTEAPARH
jgi:hypothetical protein